MLSGSHCYSRVKIVQRSLNALRDLRHTEPDKVTLIWADALCINQADISESNQQVQQMGAVYSTAQKTVIYLGPTADGLESIIKQHHRINEMDRDYVQSDSNLQESSEATSVLQQEMAVLVGRPWFTRVWIYQELVLSKNPWIQCGIKRLGRSSFSLILYRLQRHREKSGPSTATDAIRRVRDMDVARYRYSAHSVDPSRYKSKYPRPRKIPNDLLDLLTQRRGLGVTDARDMVFAHIGLLTGKEARLNLKVEYSQTIRQVFTQAANHIMSTRSDFELLINVESGGDTRRRCDLPSWVPDWTVLYSTTNPQNPLYLEISQEIGREEYSDSEKDPQLVLNSSERLLCNGTSHGRLRRLSQPLEFQDCMIPELKILLEQLLEVPPDSHIRLGDGAVTNFGVSSISDILDEFLREHGIDETYIKDHLPHHWRLSRKHTSHRSVIPWQYYAENAVKCYVYRSSYQGTPQKLSFAGLTTLTLHLLAYSITQTKTPVDEFDRVQAGLAIAGCLQGKRIGACIPDVYFNPIDDCVSVSKAEYPCISGDFLDHLYDGYDGFPIGLVPAVCTDGDAVYFLEADNRPFVLREFSPENITCPTEDEDKAKHLSLVGQFYSESMSKNLLDSSERLIIH